MRIGFYPKLAASNMKKNRKTYFPYVLTCILTIAMFYVFKSLALNPGIEKMFGGSTIGAGQFCSRPVRVCLSVLYE